MVLSAQSGCTTLKCCMDYCDYYPDCFGTSLLLGTQNNNCTFYYPPNGTHVANSAYNIAYLYQAANQPVYFTTRTTTTTTTTRTSSSLTFAGILQLLSIHETHLCHLINWQHLQFCLVDYWNLCRLILAADDAIEDAMVRLPLFVLYPLDEVVDEAVASEQ